LAHFVAADIHGLAVAVNGYVYPIAYVVVKKTNSAKDFGDLQNQSVALPATDRAFLRLFVERDCKERGKSLENFFSKITTPDNFEEPLDDVVDGKLQAVVADRAALEGFKRLKPGRFAQLKNVAQSQPFPPPTIGYCDHVLDKATLDKFRRGLLDARKKERGQTMLTLFKLTAFESVPADFGKVLTQTRKNYPPDQASPH
jgi:ABC-type phosphate/phosphonate transport system substrate-binding protein